MPPKKGKKGGGKKEPLDDTTEKLWRAYRRHLQAAGLTMPRKLYEKFMELRDEKHPQNLNELIIWEEVGPEQIIAIFGALTDLRYQYLREIRLFHANVQDEGIRAIYNYFQQVRTVHYLDIVDCNFSHLGCDFISKSLSPGGAMVINMNLNHNNIGDEGIKLLSHGLSLNNMLMCLNLQYCNLGSEAGRYIFEILINQSTQLKEMYLNGNYLRNAGAIFVFRGLNINGVLTKIDLTDNQFGEDEGVLIAIRDMLHNNTSLKELILKHNGFYNDGCNAIWKALSEQEDEGMRKNETIIKIEFGEKAPIEIIKEIGKICLLNKKRKRKKGKRKGKKKKR